MPYKHDEAFCLMWYGCKCGHREMIWNSRDGVTPFGMRCTSCGRPDMRHIDWQLDQVAPAHKLHRGQRFWRDGTPDEAEAIMRKRIESANGKEWDVTEEMAATLIAHARDDSHGGEFQKGWPMLDVHGYVEKAP